MCPSTEGWRGWGWWSRVIKPLWCWIRGQSGSFPPWVMQPCGEPSAQVSVPWCEGTRPPPPPPQGQGWVYQGVPPAAGFGEPGLLCGALLWIL